MINEQDVDAYIARQLLMLRQTMGITQKLLAQEAGVCTQQIQKYERGQSRIFASKLMQFADAFEVPVLVFYPVRDHVMLELTPPASVRFNRLINRIAPEHHAELYAVLKALAKLSTGHHVEDAHA